MDSTPATNSWKNDLLGMGFSENVIEIALWQTNDLEAAIAYIYDVIYEGGFREMSFLDYKLYRLLPMGHSPEAVSKAVEKLSLSEAVEYLINFECESQDTSKNLAENQSNLAENLLYLNIQKESELFPENPFQNQAKPIKKKRFNRLRLFAKNVGKNINKLYKKISHKSKTNKNESLRNYSWADKLARQLEKEGKSFETAFNVLKRALTRNKKPKIIRTTYEEEKGNASGNEDSTNDLLVSALIEEELFHQDQIRASLYQTEPYPIDYTSYSEAEGDSLYQERINKNYEFPTHLQYEAWSEAEEELPQNDLWERFNENDIFGSGQVARSETEEAPSTRDEFLEENYQDFPFRQQLEEWSEAEEEIKYENNEEAYDRIITGEEIVIDGIVINATPQLDIMNALERYYRPKGISESNLEKLKEIKYIAGMSPESCSICMEAFKANESLQILPCKHWFHNDCIKKWLKMSTKCPLDLLEI